MPEGVRVRIFKANAIKIESNDVGRKEGPDFSKNCIYVFSFLHQLSAWHCTHSMLIAVLPQQSMPPGAQRQTREQRRAASE